VLQNDAVTLAQQVMNVLPPTPAGKRAAWVWQRVLAIAAGTAAPNRSELEEHYGQEWLYEVPMDESFARMASLAKVMRDVHVEPAPADEVRLVIDLADGKIRRFRCVVEQVPPHRIVFQVFSPAMSRTSYIDRVVERDGRRVHVRDFGGDGPSLLLWHGAGVDATIWEAVIPHLTLCRVVAQDLPGHGRSPIPRLSVADATADADAVITDLGLGEPILAGLSVGGWAALHYAATRPCRALVCLDGPTHLDYHAMGLRPGHPGFVPDPPDVPADFASLRCSTMVVLCAGESPDDAQSMVPFRTGLAEHLTAALPHIRVEWLQTGHMLVLSKPKETAALINEFVAAAAE
jgi:pimeloyl-ACP methyl ester carboxylesterase